MFLKAWASKRTFLDREGISPFFLRSSWVEKLFFQPIIPVDVPETAALPFAGREESPDTIRQHRRMKVRAAGAKVTVDGKCRRKDTAHFGFAGVGKGEMAG